MPRLSLDRLPKTSLAIVAGTVALGAMLGVLYVILAGPVHALDRVPDALARLKPENAPVAAPAVAFTDGAGKRHMLGEFKGRYVLVNLWATWCLPCVKELPALAGLKARIAPGRLTVLAINVGRSNAEETAAFLEAHHAANLGVWRDTNVALMRSFKAYGLPTSVLIDPEGREVARAVGAADWDAPQALSYFKALPMPTPPSGGKPAHAAS